MTPDDVVLVARAQAGDDRRAFAELVRRHQGRVRALLRRLCREDAALADDLAQDAFVQAWRALPTFRAEASFAGWMQRIAYNRFLMHVRATRAPAARTLPMDAVPELPADEPSPAALAEAAVAGAEVRRALDVLSPAERMAIVQCYYLGHSHEQAAAAMGCPVGTVKSHIFRARGKLKLALAAWAPLTTGEP
ncbi:MAG: sigma-70 family RNA polymerase sigma factor [Fulvimonas sp.]|nr:sigma-70 family RNA polymerase sigma factor [Fulvimonas sp.]